MSSVALGPDSGRGCFKAAITPWTPWDKFTVALVPLE